MNTPADFSFTRGEYISTVDGARDWYLFHAGARPACVLVLHGHGSHGDQLLTRADLEPWRQCLNELEVSVVTPNLRDNSWMSAPAVTDLAELLTHLKATHPWQRLVIASGSMGGTGALIFAMRHPELVDGVVALGAATSLARYAAWCDQPGQAPVIYDIRDAIRQAYPTAQELQAHDLCVHADRLTMPVQYYHGAADEIIPVTEAQALAEQLQDNANFRLTLVPDGNHDSPLPFFRQALTDMLDRIDGGLLTN